MKVSLLFLVGVALGTASFAQTNMQNDTRDAAAGDYPACSSSVTDRCIQTYERSAGRSAVLAVGGPYEPVSGHAGAMSQQYAAADQQNDLTGMGGPLDERTGYPSCDPGPGDDSCIQLYEHGVTGTGN